VIDQGRHSVHEGFRHNKERQRGPHRRLRCYHHQERTEIPKTEQFYNCEGKLEVYAILIYVNKVKTLLSVGYRPPDKHISDESRTQYFNQFAGNYLTVADLNAHNPLCGDQDACSEGRKLFKAIENSELGTVNSRQMTCRSKQYNTETTTDLAFTDYELL
jgi:hypothetical protein